MGHTIEPASTGRAKCRGCGTTLPKGALRLGERLPNPFSDKGDMTLWFHLECGAFKRPAALLEALAETTADIERRAWLEQVAREGVAHEPLTRVDIAQRSPTNRAACHQCHEKIAKGAWRLRLLSFDDGLFSPAGFLHASCAGAHLGSVDLLERLEHFGSPLEADERAELIAELQAASG